MFVLKVLLTAAYPDPKPLHEVCFASILRCISSPELRVWLPPDRLLPSLPQSYLVKLLRTMTLHSHDMRHLYADYFDGVRSLFTSRCTSLTVLTLTQSRMYAALIAQVISGLPNLTWLDLSRSDCYGMVMKAIGGTCTQLRRLRLVACNTVADSELEYICH